MTEWAKNSREVMSRCGISGELLEYAYKKVSNQTLADIVWGAPITLVEKRQLIDLAKEGVEQRIIWDDLRMALDEAMLASQAEGNRIAFYLIAEWYDTDDILLKEYPVGMFATVEAALEYVRREDMEEDPEGEAYYRIEMWQLDDIDWEMPRYDFFTYRGEICWFEKLRPEKQEHGNTYYMMDSCCFSVTHRDLDFETPYVTGDILQIDCRPFGPAFHAMILEGKDQFDCCFPTVIFNVPETDIWRITSLKHKNFFKNHLGDVLSPLYRLRKVTDEEFTTEDGVLSKLSHAISGDEERAAAIWEAARTHDDMSIEAVKELFGIA